jgi:PAS domain S-box-containing protein
MHKLLFFDNLKDKALRYAWNIESFSRRPALLRYGIPLGLTLLTTWIICVPLSFIGSFAPFLTYFSVIFFSAWYGGSRSALVAGVASALCSWIFIYPRHEQEGHGFYFLFLILLFLAEALIVTALFAVIEHTLKKTRTDEETYRCIIEKNAEGFLMADEAGFIKYVCSSVQQILGYEKKEILGTSLTALIHPDEIKSFNLRFLKILRKNGNSMFFLQRLKTKQGDWKWIEGCVNNMLNDPNIKRIVFNYRNVTERISQAKQQEDFIHMAAHELKTPITALRGYVQLLLMNHRKENRSADTVMLDRMNKQTDRLLNLIDEMLNVTRIRAGELLYHFKRFDINEMVVDVADSFKATANNHRIIVVSEPVPNINGDKDRINQVLSNLINNAVKYAPDDPEILVKVFCQNEHVVVTVKDNGIGIPKDQQKKIFDRFYRSETLPKDIYQGLGLGLYIAMDIVKKHNGKMGVESEVGKGSEFWFSLPLVAESEPVA